MKINSAIAAMVLTIGLFACTNEPDKDALWKKMDYPVALSLEGKSALRATQTSNLYEREIKNLAVVVFTYDNISNAPIAVEKVITLDKNQLPTDPYTEKSTFEMGMEGTFQLEVIANGYDASDKDTFVRKFRQGMSYEEFKNVVFDRPLPKHGEAGFVMLNMEPVKVTTKKGIRVDADKKISLRRLACRIDLLNQLPDEIKITKVTLRNQIKSSFLLPQTVLPENSDGGAISYTKQDGNWFTKTVISGGIYSYETPIAMNGYEAATTLLLEGTYNNTPWRKEIEFKKKDGGEYIPLLRNHLYRVYLIKGNVPLTKGKGSLVKSNGTTPGGGEPADADKVICGIEVLDWSEDIIFGYTYADVMNAEHTNPLAYVAEYNIDKNGTGFVKDRYATNVSGYYNFGMAVKRFSTITIGDNKYHLPSMDEWKAIVPSGNDLYFSSAAERLNYSEDVSVAGKSVACLQDIKGSGNNVCYALRLKGTEYQSAWKYEYVKEHNCQVMRITTRSVADGVTIANVATEAFWQQNNSGDIVRIFPASGKRSISNGSVLTNSEGSDGYFCSSTPYESEGAYSMHFSTSYATEGSFRGLHEYTIRLFKDAM